MITLLLHLLRLFPFFCGGHRQLAIENLALRQQLGVYKRPATRPGLRTTDRLFWVGLARVWSWSLAIAVRTSWMTRSSAGAPAGREHILKTFAASSQTPSAPVFI